MKDVNEMTKQEVKDEIAKLAVELDKAVTDEHYDEIHDRLEELDYALTHNFPSMIGGNDCEDAFTIDSIREYPIEYYVNEDDIQF